MCLPFPISVITSHLASCFTQIPEKVLEHQPPQPPAESRTDIEEPPSVRETPFHSDDEIEDEEPALATQPIPVLTTQDRRPRRLSTYESSDGGMDLESDVIGGSARR